MSRTLFPGRRIILAMLFALSALFVGIAAPRLLRAERSGVEIAGTLESYQKKKRLHGVEYVPVIKYAKVDSPDAWISPSRGWRIRWYKERESIPFLLFGTEVYAGSAILRWFDTVFWAVLGAVSLWGVFGASREPKRQTAQPGATDNPDDAQ